MTYTLLKNMVSPHYTGSDNFTTLISNEIATHHGRLSFDRFMALALYHPEYGYYKNNVFDLGKRGDFTTASEISPLFAQCFAQPYRQLREHLGQIDILELGAGTGRFAGNILTELSLHNALPNHYYIYEISPHLREKQKHMLTQDYPSIVNKVIWLDQLPNTFNGMIIANEVLDALPVHCFQIEGGTIKERCVAIENDQFIWKTSTPLSDDLAHEAEQLRQRYDLDDGYISEINLQLSVYIKTLANLLTQGIILFSDYGYGQAEYYHPERRHGTLTCFYQHRHHNNPLILPGKQDITAHVDFTRVIEIAATHGCTLNGFTTQAAFLLDCGLQDRVQQAEHSLDPVDLVNLHHAVKLLTLPTEMGERVKVMALGKNIALQLRGFNFQDRRREL